MNTHAILPAVCAVLLGSALASAQQTPPQFGSRPLPFRPRPRPNFLIVPAPPTEQTQFGDPLPGLTAEQLAAFADGMEEFENIETAETGLGPTFNNVSCVSCHSAAATGGASNIHVTRFGRLVDGKFDPMTGKGGTLLQQSAIDPAVQEKIPDEANVIARRQTTPLFGLGLIEAIPDREILANARRFKPDGIKGKPAMIQDVVSGEMRVGHFGWKAQQATLLAFAADAYLNEMGITNRFFPTENAPNGNTELLAQFDNYADPEDQIDPETGKADIDVVADFIRFLAPPPPMPPTPETLAGQRTFVQIGCANCHQPVMTTDPNVIPSLDRKPVPLYSDLLLHDMGALGDGIAQSAAGPREMKTPPLWGLRASAPYLHDARATTVDEAIRAHDGEAARTRDRYLPLSPVERQQLLEFLRTL